MAEDQAKTTAAAAALAKANEDWAKTTAKKIAGRIPEEAERAGIRKKRHEDGVERFRKQLLDLVSVVNANIETEASRIHAIVLENGVILTAAYKRIVTVEEFGAVPDVPAAVGKIVLNREDRKAATQPEAQEVYITQAGTQVAFYHGRGKDLKQFLDAEFKQVVEYFAS
jgi:hypothetical protein